MIEAPSLASAAAPPPLAAAPAIDRTHLFRMTLGDHSLEREVLDLFARQSAILVARMASTNAAGIAAFAHTLKGSARGIGAWSVARAAEAVEAAADNRSDTDAAVAALAAAAAEARAAIAELIKPH